MIPNDQLESDTKRMQATCCKLQGSPRRSRTQMGATAGCIGSILTLPKFHLATLSTFKQPLLHRAMTSNTTQRARDGANEIQRDLKIGIKPFLLRYQNVLLFAPRFFPCTKHEDFKGSVYIIPVKSQSESFIVKTCQMFSVHTTPVKLEVTGLKIRLGGKMQPTFTNK